MSCLFLMKILAFFSVGFISQSACWAFDIKGLIEKSIANKK